MKKVRSMIGKKGKMKSETLKEKKPKKKKKEDIHKLGNQPGMYKSTHSEDIIKKEENKTTGMNYKQYKQNNKEKNPKKKKKEEDEYDNKIFSKYEKTLKDKRENEENKKIRDKKIDEDLNNRLDSDSKLNRLQKEKEERETKPKKKEKGWIGWKDIKKEDIMSSSDEEEEKGKDPDDDIIISEGESSSDEEGDTVEKFGETWTIRNEEGEKIKNEIKNANTLKDLNNVENEINETGVKNGVLRSLTKLIVIREKEIKNKPKPTNKKKLKVININHGSNKVNLKERSKTQNIKDLKLYKDSYDELLKRRLQSHFNPKVLVSQKNNYNSDNNKAVLKMFKSTIEIISKENISLESKEYKLKYNILNILFNDLGIILYILYLKLLI